MSIPAQLLVAIGDWVGHNKLWFEPCSVAFECETTATLPGPTPFTMGIA